MNFTVTLGFPTSTGISAAGFRLTAPSGWTFASISGPNEPVVYPREEATATWEFAYLDLSTRTVTFSFSANYRDGLSGNQVFRNVKVIVRAPGVPLETDAADVVINAPSSSGGGGTDGGGNTGGGGTTVVAPVISVQPKDLNLAEGQAASFSVTATGTAPLTYQWRKDGAAIAGATSATFSLASVSASSAGTYTVAISNSAGSATSLGAVLKVSNSVLAPQILVQPRDTTIAAGTPFSLSVTASGTAPLSYQWRKGGTVIAGATNANLALAGQVSDAGSYAVSVSNSVATATSTNAVVVVTSTPLALTIAAQPVSQTISAGGTATFRVVAAGAAAFTYQWQKDGTPIAGETSDTLTVANAATSAAGSYRVFVSAGANTVASSLATLTVSGRATNGVYFGSFANNGGSLALMVRADRTAVLLGYASGARLALLGRDIVVDASGRFSFSQPDPRGASTASIAGAPPTAAAESDLRIDGTISADGTLSGSVTGLNLSFTAPAPTTTGSTVTLSGFYEAGAVGGSARSYAIVSPAGQALLVVQNGITADGGVGSVSASGAVSVTTAANASVSGIVSAETAMIAATVTSAGASSISFVGANSDTRLDIEKLTNISTRSQTGTTANTLIAGFVITGEAAKPVLIRAIGPTLGTAFGVAGALSAARLEIFRGETRVAVGDDWGAADATAIAAAASRVGAFGLPTGSRDASLLLTLEPGAYTAVVTGQGGASGVSLVEIYDATVGAIPRTRRIINIATRASVGTGDNALIAGFYVSGTVPKRLLIRGVGPALTQFGVGGVLARPQLAVRSGATVLAQNAGWSTSPDASTIAVASAQVGAFAFPVGSNDAALIVHLSPGGYTAQISSADAATGVALIEVYELP